MKRYKCMPVIRLVKEPGEIKAVKLVNSYESAMLFRELYDNDIELYESMWMVTLNRANLTTGYCKISQGGMTGTVADVRIIAKYAIEAMANGVIIAHNHPSGSLIPSRADTTLTQKVKEGLELLDVQLLDHLILAPAATKDENPYYSFAEEGQL